MYPTILAVGALQIPMRGRSLVFRVLDPKVNPKRSSSAIQFVSEHVKRIRDVLAMHQLISGSRI